ncbi:MAG: hypothetical protein EG826_14000 [Deltaproteobacteria bacterium]|nr:hypothetical protein [Deltaproteobacteria bacterium]
MFKRASFVFCVLLFFLGSTAALAAGESRQSVAVLDFESIGSEEHLGKAVAEIMRTELIGTNKYRVVERAQISRALSEQKFQKSGLIDDRSAVEIGKLVGADLIVIGSVVKIGNAYTINSRMIETKTGEARLGKNATGNDLNLLTSLSRNLLDDLFGGGSGQRSSDSKARLAKQPLRIIKAVYGTGEIQMDVTEVLRNKIVNGQVAIPVNNDQFGRDPLFGSGKGVDVRYETDEGQYQTFAYERQNLVIPSPLDARINARSRHLEILKATYGNENTHMDVTRIVRNHIFEGSVAVFANNVFFGGDPLVNTRKRCMVRYRTEDGTFETFLDEDQIRVIPEAGDKRIR